MATILVLGHYCESHGPTAICCTEGLPVGCATCFQDERTMSMRRPSSSRSLNPADGLAGVPRIPIRSKSASSDPQSGDAGNRKNSSSSVIETPPESPRVAALQGAQTSGLRRDSSFRKTYDENDKKNTACENCALTLPKQTKESPATNKLDGNGPVLRSRMPYERINVPSPPKTNSSNSSNSSDCEHATSNKTSHRRTRSRTLVRTGTSSSDSSSFSTNSHNHFLDYTSTHEPLAPTSFSLVRQSCLRTLSCETLPPNSSPQSTTAPNSPFVSQSFSSNSGPNSAASTSGCGPIFFGDPQAGYTTAYTFRIPDPNARGRRRVYALMALSTHRERAAMQSFSFLSEAFRKTAAWIQGLAEAELERQETGNSPRSTNSNSEGSSNNTPTSAFLSSRRGDSKFAGMIPRAKGLAELVGMPDFFFELHKVFVQLLVELNMKLGL